MSVQQGREKRPRSLVACGSCRKRRSRCEPAPVGPSCGKCQQLGSECSFTWHGRGQFERERGVGMAALAPLAAPGHLPSLSNPDTTTTPSNVVRRQSEVLAHSPVSDELAFIGMHVSHFPDELDEERRVPDPHSNWRTVTKPPDRAAGLDHHTGRFEWDERRESIQEYTATNSKPQGVDFRGATDPEIFSLVSRGMGDTQERGLVDPVNEGIINMGQLETAFQVFKHHCSTILPYPSLLTTRSRAPTHPFLRSAFLVYTSRCPNYRPMLSEDQVRRLEQNVALNLMAFHRGCPPSLESAYAALILSLLPPGDDNFNIMSDFDPARMVGMAYGQIREMGHSVFVERLVDSLGAGTPLAHLNDSLDKARLHFCIMARVSWTNLSRCPSNDLPTSLRPIHLRLLELLEERGSTCELDRQLRFEYQSLQILMTLSETWRELERVTTPSIVELRKGNLATLEAGLQLSDLKTRLWAQEDPLIALQWVSAQMTYSKWWMTIRNVWFSYRLPSPLVVPELQIEWLEGLSLAAKASCDMATLCIEEDWKLHVFPRAVGVSLVLCYHTLSMGAAHLKHYSPTTPLPIYLDIEHRLKRLQLILAGSALSIKTMLNRAQVTLDEYKRQLAGQSRKGSDHGQERAPTDGSGLFNFGFGGDFQLDASGFEGLGQTGSIGIGLWDPLMGFNDGWDWQQTDDSGKPFWDRS